MLKYKLVRDIIVQFKGTDGVTRYTFAVEEETGHDVVLMTQLINEFVWPIGTKHLDKKVWLRRANVETEALTYDILLENDVVGTARMIYNDYHHIFLTD